MENQKNFKKLFEVKVGDTYVVSIWDKINSIVKTVDKVSITKVEDKVDSVFIEFGGLLNTNLDPTNSWDMTKSAGSSISIGTENEIYFFGTCEESMKKGIQDYIDGNFVTPIKS